MRKLYIIGDISQEGYLDFAKKLDKLEEESKEKIVVELGSDGGSPSAGLMYFDRIRASECKIIIHAIGTIQSAAIIVLAAGDFRIGHTGTDYMVHEGREYIKGTFTTSDLKDKAKKAIRFEWHWENLMELRTGTPAAKWRALSRKETFFNSERALALGLIDFIQI